MYVANDSSLFSMMKEEKEEEAAAASTRGVVLLEPHFRLLSSLQTTETTTSTAASLRSRQLQDFQVAAADDDTEGDDVSYLGEDEEYDPACDGMSTK
jgi:hypothetical protein